MTTNFVDEMTNAGKVSYDAIQKLGEINTKTLNRLATLQMSLATLGFESGMQQMQLVSSVKDYNDFLNAETEFANTVQSRVMEIANKASDLFSESQDEVMQWMSDEFPAIADELKTAAPKAKAKKKTRKKAATKKTAKKS